jgi:hypothetical protein
LLLLRWGCWWHGQGVALLEGKLHKHSPKKARVKRWQRRHFVLTPSALTYYKKKGGTQQQAHFPLCPRGPFAGDQHPPIGFLNKPSFYVRPGLHWRKKLC